MPSSTPYAEGLCLRCYRRREEVLSWITVRSLAVLGCRLEVTETHNRTDPVQSL